MARTESPVLDKAIERLREAVGSGTLIDVGYKAATPLGISPATLRRATFHLRDNEGFSIIYMPMEQRLNGKRAIIKVLAPPGTTFVDVYHHRTEIKKLEKEKV